MNVVNALLAIFIGRICYHLILKNKYFYSSTMPSMLAVFLGILLTFVACGCVCFNIFMLIILWRGSFLTPKYGGVYLLAFSQICSGTVTCLLAALYLGPSVIAQSTIFETLTIPQFIGFIFHAQWFQDLLLQVVTALNRWLVIVHPSTASVFSRTKTIIIIATVSFVGISLGILTNYVMPCCPVFLHYKVYSAAFLSNNFNVSDFAFDLPINTSCSLIAIFCYWRIYVYIHASNTQISSILSKKDFQSRRIKETRLALQLAACTGFCILGWISLRVIPLFVTLKAEAFIIVTFSELCHCISTSVVFLLFNTEIRQKILPSNVLYENNGINGGISTAASGQT